MRITVPLKRHSLIALKGGIPISSSYSQEIDEREKLEPLSWDLRIQIAIDVARALEYLHDGEDFFFILHDILVEMEEVLSATDSRCSCAIMKLKFNGVSIDLLYASISLLVVPRDNKRLDTISEGLSYEDFGSD
ncbi:Nuclear poly(A) polymerase 4 [Camellia lanceoleosa]|uniref:Nuclear poly(A) polymerase 4 n=1 Tax=Camellia lanceoleosa TaxID=1840588 RepID=A0ACC0HHH8_9ERIC|nr:Nuclear poly(A) polymerase 4 [Camellia lanceoleosa]